MKLYKKITYAGTLELLSGLHIGDSKESVEIGGVDSPIVRRKDNNEPYLPGSSIKGKLRSLLEVATGCNAGSKFRISDYSGPEGELIPVLFGAGGDNGLPSRLIVRDAYLTPESSKRLKESDFTDMPYTEIKFENVINRIKGVAEHPRQIERIPAGAIFNVEFIINVMDNGTSNPDELGSNLLKLLEAGIDLLHDDYLGGSGSRGYGKVRFTKSEGYPQVKLAEEYLNRE